MPFERPGDGVGHLVVGLVGQAVEQHVEGHVGTAVEGGPDPDTCLGMVQPLGERHDGQHLLPARLGGRLQPPQPAEQVPQRRPLRLDGGDVIGQCRRGVELGVVQRRLDLGEAQTERLEVLDRQQATQVRGRIQALRAGRASARDEQAQVVVVAQRAHRQAGSAGDLPDPQRYGTHVRSVSGPIIRRRSGI